MHSSTSHERIVLIDLDGTIIDGDYNTNSETLRDSVYTAQCAGWKVGLSSDSSYENLVYYRDKFEMNGPIIAEKGAVVEDLNGQIHYESERSSMFTAAHIAIKDHFKAAGVEIWEGNPVVGIKEGTALGRKDGPLILVSNERLCSTILFFREQSRGMSCPSIALLRSHDDAVSELIPNGCQHHKDLNEEYGLIIFSDASVNKRVGTNELKNKTAVGRIAMIGNSYDDFVGHDIAEHYAVANSSSRFKAKANFIATRPYTQGVIEILEHIVDSKDLSSC